MENGWRDRLLAAIDEDERSDRAISLAAGLGPNFISQMRGTKAAAPKKPNIEYVRKLAAVLNRDLSAIIGPDDAEPALRAALLAYGIDKDDIPAVMRAIKGFLEPDDERPQQGRPRDRSEPASPRHAKEPS